MRSQLALALAILSVPLFSQSPVFVLDPQGHAGRIQSILPTPDRQTIVTLGGDKSICIWDAHAGQLIRKKWLDIGAGDNGRFIDADISLKSGMVAVARINAEGRPVVNLIDVNSDRVMVTFEGFSHDLGFVRIDPQERFIITGASGVSMLNSEPIRLWKIPSRQSTPQRVSKATVESVGVVIHDFSFFNNGDDFVIMAMFGDDVAFHVEHNPSAIPEFDLKKRPIPVSRLGHSAYSQLSGRLFTVTHHGRATLVDRSGKATSLFPDRKGWGTNKGDSATTQVAISPSGSFGVVTAGVKEEPKDFIEIYDLDKKTRIATIDGWHQIVTFLSDSTIASESKEGFGIYNVNTGKRRVIWRSSAGVQDNIQYGTGGRILFDSSRRIFDFEKLEIYPAEQKESFSATKMVYHDNRLAIESPRHVLVMNRRNYYLTPMAVYDYVSFLNDGKIVASKLGYRSFGHSLLLYDIIKSSAWNQQAETIFESLVAIKSIAPHPDVESKLFATRDALGVISIYDPNGPSVEIFKSLLRLEPFKGLRFDEHKEPAAFAWPGDDYAGPLKRGDKIISINGMAVENEQGAVRILEGLDPTKPVAVEAMRGKQSLQSVEKLNTIRLRAPLLSFAPLENNEWICWTPQGYYASSTNGERSGGWVIDKGVNAFAEFHPIYDFKKQFYKPELVKLVAKNSSMEKAVIQFNETAEQPLSVSSGLSEKLPPSVSWVSPARDTTISRSRVRLTASVLSQSNVQSVKVLLNGRTILRRDQITIRRDRDTPMHTVSFEMDLVANDNTINLFVENEFGTTISLERVLKVNQVETDLEKYKPNLYLLSVGISQHSIPGYSLSFAHNDAKGVEQVYLAQKGLLFKNVFTKTLLNEKATRSEILEAFYWLEQNATQKDVVVIFMASHGLNDKDRFYILPYDGDPEKIRISGVDWANFADVLGNLPSKVLVFIDACHSGKLGTNVLAKRGDTDLFEALRTLAREENGVVIMAASTGKESSLESPEWQHGAFTYALLEGLRDGKADLNSDGIVNIREIDYFVADRVKTLTNGRQHPTTQKPSVVSEFPLMMLRK